MNKKLTLKTAIFSTLFVATLFGTACSHQETREGWEGMKDGATDAASDVKGSENDSTGTDVAAASTNSGDAAKADAAENATPNDAAVDANKEQTPASSDAAADANKDQAAASTEAAPPDSSSENKSSEEPTLMAEQTNASPAPVADASKASVPATPEAPTAPPEVASANESTPPAADTAKADTSTSATTKDAVSAPDSEDKAVASEPTVAAPTHKSHLASLPEEAVKNDGQLMNRYYFIRKGDSSAAVAEKLMGLSDMASQLTKWNGGKSTWKVGHLMMYPSTQAPNDGQIQSFYSEKSVAPKTYAVKAGDTLSSIAQSQYGDLRSWTEIATESKIANPDMIRVGTKLTLFAAPANGTDDKVAMNTQPPKNRHDTGASIQDNQDQWKADPAEKVAAQSAKTESPVAAAAPSTATESQTTVARENISLPPQVAPNLPMPAKVTPPVVKPAPSLASMEIVRFIQHNLFMVAMALGAAGFLLWAAFSKRGNSDLSDL